MTSRFCGEIDKLLVTLIFVGETGRCGYTGRVAQGDG